MNKKAFTKVGLLILVVCFLAPGVLFAKPEHYETKSKTEKIRQAQAKARLKHVDLKAIEDPATQQALQEIINYLGLNAHRS